MEGRSVPMISRSKASVKSGFASFGGTTSINFFCSNLPVGVKITGSEAALPN